MANNTVQIKRSLTTAIPASLANGELAWTSNGDVLYIGANSTIVAIAGKRVPGVLTANQAIVVNATSGVDKIIVGNLVSTFITANNTQGSAGQLLASGGAGNIYWTTPAASVAGANTQIQFNDSGTLAGNVELTFDKTTSTLSISNGASGTANVQANATFIKVANSSSSANLEPNKLSIGTTVINGSSLTVQDATINGNLTISGALTTIDTTTLSVKDNMVILADQQANSATFTDAVDAGWYVPTGNTLNTFYSGVSRIAALSTNTNPYFKLFGTSTAPGSTTITGATIGTLQAYLLPYGSGGAFVANSSNISIAANSSLAVAVNANTLSLTTALAATSGGTGLSSYTKGDIIISSATNTLSSLAIGSDGYVLQVNASSSAPYWGTIDGGVF